MAKLVVIAVFDVQAAAFHRPIFVATRGVGVRMISDEINRGDPNNLLHQHPSDFRVFELGTFDEQTGLFECHRLPELVVDGTALVSA